MKTASGNPVQLVNMPFAPVERPSISLGILKAALEQRGIPATVIHANLDYAGEKGLLPYHGLSRSPANELAGEWIFAAAAFPDFNPAPDAYLNIIGSTCNALYSITSIVNMRGFILQERQKAADFIERTAQQLLERPPLIVGCTATFQQTCASLALLRRLRQLAPGIITVMGGPQCEPPMGHVLHQHFDWVDYVVCGDGEEVFPGLCEKLLSSSGKLPPGAVPPGILSRHERQADHPPIRAMAASLDSCPTPNYDEYFARLQRCSFASQISPTLPVETSRGCWWGARRPCRFCGLHGSTFHPRIKNPGLVKKEIETLLARHRLNCFSTADTNPPPAHLNAVARQLAGRGKAIEVFTETSTVLSREQMRNLSAAGIRWLQPGIESLDDEVLNLLQKGSSTLQNLRFLKWAREFSIHATWLFLYDIPRESDDACARMASWLPLISHLQSPHTLTRIIPVRYSVYHQEPARWGLNLEPTPVHRHIFPMDEKALRDFAYYFCSSPPPAANSPGLRALLRAVLNWQKEWIRHLYPDLPGRPAARLFMRDDGHALQLDDTRLCAPEASPVLAGLQRTVYLACEDGPSKNPLMQRLSKNQKSALDWKKVHAILAELEERKLTLKIKGHFLALATPTPQQPYPGIQDFPGGQVSYIAPECNKRDEAAVREPRPPLL
ncbi:MAG: RiPP maturation radical SAM C-methyltransferase [Verrucomicrobiae bacterium]|nr:RiPP maturation radical SAM C-methyltransferase [Verrucomicrobiae bacterium]